MHLNNFFKKGIVEYLKMQDSEPDCLQLVDSENQECFYCECLTDFMMLFTTMQIVNRRERELQNFPSNSSDTKLENGHKSLQE